MICTICSYKDFEEFFDDWLGTYRYQCVNCGCIIEDDEDEPEK